MAYTFDGVNKLIILSTGTSSVDAKDMYSRWKDWVQASDNSKFLVAMSVLGGDPLPGGRYLGTTFFMENGWKIRPYEGNHTLVLSGNLYSRDGSDPFVNTIDAFNVRIMLSVSNLVDTVNVGGGVGTATDVANAVWNATQAAYTTSGSMGASLGAAGTAGDPWIANLSTYNTAGTAGKAVKDLLTQTDTLETSATNTLNAINTIPGLVWDEKLSNHTVNGSFGEELATHSDIQASASTSTSTYSSGSIIAGTVSSGTIANTVIRDGVYWNISESNAGGTGLTVEYNFNLASSSHRAGTFNLYGRYDGKGSAHYIELWAWNVAGSAWEQLHENFIQSSTVDAEYSHAYYEEHINRASSNEVKIRLVHNVTTYHNSHTLHIDSCNVSAIDVITAAEIAEAVRVELTPELAHVLALENNPGLTNTQATMLIEMYELLGLDVTKPLVVTQTSRTAGTISQSIATNSTQTTVQRV